MVWVKYRMGNLIFCEEMPIRAYMFMLDNECYEILEVVVMG